MPTAHGGRLLPYSVDASAAEDPAEEARNEQATDTGEEPATLSPQEDHQACTLAGPPRACLLSADTFPKPAPRLARPLRGPLCGHHPDAEKETRHTRDDQLGPQVGKRVLTSGPSQENTMRVTPANWGLAAWHRQEFEYVGGRGQPGGQGWRPRAEL